MQCFQCLDIKITCVLTWPVVENVMYETLHISSSFYDSLTSSYKEPWLSIVQQLSNHLSRITFLFFKDLLDTGRGGGGGTWPQKWEGDSGAPGLPYIFYKNYPALRKLCQILKQLPAFTDAFSNIR